MEKVVIHYPFVPHYRVPIFNLMTEKLDCCVEVWSSIAAKDQYLKSDDSGWRFEHRRTVHKLLFGRFEFEFGVFSRLLRLRPAFYIVLANPNIITSWIYPLIARILGCKVLFWSHGLLQPAKGFKRIPLSLYYKIPHGFLLYGERTIPWLVELGLERKHLHPIYNSLDYPSQAKEREKLRETAVLKPRNALRLVVTGRLMKKLKIDCLVGYLARYINKNPTLYVSLVVIGDGPELASLRQLVKSLNMEKSISFMGAIYDEMELAKIYCSSSASVIMGVAGLAVMHSLAYGVPVITHDNLAGHCPEIEALLNSSAGIFFKDGNYDSFSLALDSIDRVQDRSQQAIRVIEQKYTPEAQLRFIKEALDVYR